MGVGPRRKFSPDKIMNFTFFSSAHGTFSRIDHILGHKASLGKFKKIEIIPINYVNYISFPGGSEVKNPPAMQETRVRSLGGEDPLPGRLLSIGSHRV